MIARQEKRDLLVLVLVFLAASFWVWFWRFQPYYQLAATVVVAAFYPLWGWWHHQRRGDWHFLLGVEYFLLALFALLFFLLFSWGRGGV